MNSYRNALLILLLSLTVILTATSCGGDEECFGEGFDYLYTTRITLQDSVTGDNLIGPIGRRYNPSLGIYLSDIQMNEVPYFIEENGLIFDIEFDNNVNFYEPLEMVYILDLPEWDGNRERDIDTVKYELTITESDDLCASLEFSYLRCTYNQGMIFEGDPRTLSSIDYLIIEK